MADTSFTSKGLKHEAHRPIGPNHANCFGCGWCVGRLRARGAISSRPLMVVKASLLQVLHLQTPLIQALSVALQRWQGQQIIDFIVLELVLLDICLVANSVLLAQNSSIHSLLQFLVISAYYLGFDTSQFRIRALGSRATQYYASTSAGQNIASRKRSYPTVILLPSRLICTFVPSW
jgi:hypothetical protein